MTPFYLNFKVETWVYKCPLCYNTFSRKANIPAHIQGQHGEGFRCTKCGKILKSRSGLNIHLTSKVHALAPEATTPGEEAPSAPNSDASVFSTDLNTTFHFLSMPPLFLEEKDFCTPEELRNLLN